MAQRRKHVKKYSYECSLTGATYQMTRKVENADDLVSVNAYYELHPEKDDRPEVAKKKLGLLEDEGKKS